MSKFDIRDTAEKEFQNPKRPIMRTEPCIIWFLDENPVSVVFKYICFNKEIVVVTNLFGGVLRSLKFWLLRRGLTSTMFHI